ncbi:MAG: hypothetical protein JSR27_13365 [Proteobacteria bacterium]|nr:hypothetical protein [Pseudomonadota bacterium]
MKHRLLALAIAAWGASLAMPAHADDAALKAEVEALRAEVAELKAQVQQMHAVQVAPAAAAVAQAAPPAPAATPPAAPNPGRSMADAATGNATSLWGYGQLDYNRPTARAADARADLTRAVLGFNHEFNETTRVYGELEWEHAIASADDAGESEVEQLFVEHALSPNYGVRVGLMLVPIGLLNEHHEPTQFYGVERNFVEQAIIPSTWREGGVAGYGTTDSGFQWDLGVVTSPDLGKWDPTSLDGRESPLGSIHQELQLSKAHDLSIWARLNWLGVPGLNIGGAVFAGKIGQDTSKQFEGDANFPADNSRLLVGEAHVRWQSGPWDFTALYTRGSISDTQDLNLSFLGQPTPVPKSFWGGYAQGAWRALEWNQSSLVPFLRYEAFNTGAAYASLPQGFEIPALPTQRVWTAGVNYYLTPNVVFKFDYQDFRYDDPALNYGNRFDLGLGFQF